MNTSELKVLGRATSSNVQKVMWLLSELNLPYERVDLGGKFGGNKEAAYLSLNPHGVVPTLIDDKIAVWESNTILRYLCNKHDAHALYPMEIAAKSLVERWMDWQLSTLGPVNTVLFQSIVRTPLAERNPELILQHRGRNAAAFTILDKQLASTTFLAGETLTLADIAIGALAYRWFELPIDRPELPSLSRWYQQLCERPAYQANVMTGLQ